MAYACRTCGTISTTPMCPNHQTAPLAAPGRSAASTNHARDRAHQRTFRTMLIKRDGPMCDGCGRINVKLEAHHDTAHDGRLLCTDCHRNHT